MINSKEVLKLKRIDLGTMADGMYGISMLFESDRHLSILRTELEDTSSESVAMGLRDLCTQIERHWGHTK